MTPEQELTYLKDQAEYLASSLDEIKQRISDLEGTAKKK
jgi:prefoldin subunit 5